MLTARSRGRREETAADLEAAGGAALVVPADLGEPGEVDTLAQRVAAEVGPLDTIVANSGIAGPTAELWNVTPEEWEETLRVNLTGTFLLCRALLPAMIERGWGSIVRDRFGDRQASAVRAHAVRREQAGPRRAGPDTRRRAGAARRARQP